MLNGIEKIIAGLPSSLTVLDVGGFGLDGENTSLALADDRMFCILLSYATLRALIWRIGFFLIFIVFGLDRLKIIFLIYFIIFLLQISQSPLGRIYRV